MLGPLPERDLLWAHGLANDRVAHPDRTGLRFWLVQGIHAWAGCALALIGFLLLDWSFFWVSAALWLDLVAILMADFLKQRLAPGPAQAEMSSTLASESLLHTIRSMERPWPWYGPPGPPQRVRSSTLRSQADPPQRFIYRGCERRIDPAYAADRTVLALGLLFALPPGGFLLLVMDSRGLFPDGSTAALLGLIVMGRLADALRESRAALRDSGAPHPQLLPQSLPMAASLFVAGIVFSFVASAVIGAHGNIGDDRLARILGAVFLSLHLITTAGLLWFWRFRLGRQAQAVRRFADLDLKVLRARWERVNGDDALLRMPSAPRRPAESPQPPAPG